MHAAGLTGLVCLAVGPMEMAPIQEMDNGGKVLRFRCEPGLYQFSLFLDATGFDWESLYQVLNVYQNDNERTGPWDFNLKTAQPLVPSYWIRLNGQKLGLWYVQRVSLEDLAAKRFRGRFAFEVRAGGEQELAFEPYRPPAVRWISARLEPDPEDSLERGLTPMRGPDALPAARLADPAYGAVLKERLAGSHAVYAEPVRALLDWVRRSGAGGPDMIPFLVAAWQMEGDAKALEKALAAVDASVALPAWGRVAEDAYGHNGDIGGAAMLRNMAWAYHLLGPHLGEERKAKLLAKLAYQGERFWEQQLLMRDYWGGSLLQDHGRKAVHDFGTAALHLWGIVPEADRWVAYIVPRIQRGLDAAPRDGVIPGSSYNGLHMFTDGVMWYADALRARTGRDLAGHASLTLIPAFATAVLDERDRSLRMVECNDKAPLIGGGHFAEVRAAHGDAHAAKLARVLRERPDELLKAGGITAAGSLFWGFLAHDSASLSLAEPRKPDRDLRVFEDSGFAHYHDEEMGAALSVKCGPWLGWHAQRLATGPCDWMEMLPAAGHFAFYVNGAPRLVSPDIGYSLRAAVRSCLLVDGAGQTGDVGYPMSIPSQPHRGDRIESVRWDRETGKGVIRLDLARAYPADLGVAHYTREFVVGRQRRLVVRDTVVLVRPRVLAWLFQIRADGAGEMAGLEGRVGADPVLRVRPEAAGLELSGRIEPTRVVYSYSSAFNRFRHLRYETVVPVEAATVEFVWEW